MSKSTQAPAASARTTWLEWLVISVLAAMAISLAYIRFKLLPAQDQRAPIEFRFENPLLQAKVGDAALSYQELDPTREHCVSVRREGVVLRPRRGKDRIGRERNLHSSRAYLACSIRKIMPGDPPCGSESRKGQVLLYPLNDMGMPIGTGVVPMQIQPRLMMWQDRQLVAYQVDFQRFGTLSGIWSTFLSTEAPATGLIHMRSLTAGKGGGQESNHAYRDVMRAIR